MQSAVLASHITAADACWPAAGHDAVHITNTCVHENKAVHICKLVTNSHNRHT